MGLRGYRPKQAQDKAKKLHLKTIKLGAFSTAFIAHLLLKKWSKEQIHGELSAKIWLDVPSHEWIYPFIYADKERSVDIVIFSIQIKTRQHRLLAWVFYHYCDLLE